MRSGHLAGIVIAAALVALIVPPATTAASRVLPTGSLADVTCDPERDLAGVVNPATEVSTGTVWNTSVTCSYDIGFASYERPDDDTDHQWLHDSVTAIIRPGQIAALTVEMPDCAWQVDLFYGPVLPSLDGQRYGSRLLRAERTDDGGWCADRSSRVSRAGWLRLTHQ